MNASDAVTYENIKCAPPRTFGIGLTQKSFRKIVEQTSSADGVEHARAFGNVVYLLTANNDDIFELSNLTVNNVQKKSFEKLFEVALQREHPLHQKAVETLLTLPKNLIWQKNPLDQHICHDEYFKTLRKLAIGQAEGPYLIDERLKSLFPAFDEATHSLFRIARLVVDSERAKSLTEFFVERAKNSDDWETRGTLLLSIADYAESPKTKPPAKPLFEKALRDLLDHFKTHSWVNHWLVKRNSFARGDMLTLFSRHGLVDPYRIAAESLTVSKDGKIAPVPLPPSRPGDYRSSDDDIGSGTFIATLAGAAIVDGFEIG